MTIIIKRSIRYLLKILGYEVRQITTRTVEDIAAFDSVRDHPSFFRHLVKLGWRPRGILDVGANSGHWADGAKRVFPDASMILIEPQEEMRQQLEYFQRNYSSITVVFAGAGSKAGVKTLTLWEDLAGSSFLPLRDPEELKEGRQREVRIVTIDDLLKRHSSFVPDLVKLDVQGYELEVLKGGQALFGQTDVFIIETSLYEFLPNIPSIYDIIVYMKDRGYVIYDVIELSRRPFDNALAQIDVVFVKSNGPFRNHQSWS